MVNAKSATSVKMYHTLSRRYRNSPTDHVKNHLDHELHENQFTHEYSLTKMQCLDIKFHLRKIYQYNYKKYYQIKLNIILSLVLIYNNNNYLQFRQNERLTSYLPFTKNLIATIKKLESFEVKNQFQR